MIGQRESDVIGGVSRVDLRLLADERGRFSEVFRSEWLPQVRWDRVQVNRSDSQPAVLRGLHYHLRQVDYWYLHGGVIRVGLCDLRRSSATYRAVEVFELRADQQVGLFVPSGVAHGFLTLTPATLTYVVNNFYDGSDELGVAWNDPQLGVPWDVDAPLLSPRDAANPLLKDIPPELLPD